MSRPSIVSKEEPFALVTCDERGVVVACTADVLGLLGVTQHDLVGQDFCRLPWHPCDGRGRILDIRFHPLKQAMVSGKETTGTLVSPHQPNPIALRVSPWLGQKPAQLACRLYPANGSSAVAEPDEQHTYKVAHDLKSPLIAVLGHLEFAEEAALQGDIGEMRREFARIDAAAERMNELLEQLLTPPRNPS